MLVVPLVKAEKIKRSYNNAKNTDTPITLGAVGSSTCHSGWQTASALGI